jgi:hypothetical protein
MTPARLQRKARPVWTILVSILGACGIAAVLTSDDGVAAVTERVVTSARTGLAIDGIDPVAYFTDSKPLEGRPEYEYRHLGAIWRFRNDGNRAAFAQSPDVYAPRYGGYDPVAIARGVAVAGNPLLWVVSGQRLYLFFSNEAQMQFIADHSRIAAEADAHWPAVAATLMQ